MRTKPDVLSSEEAPLTAPDIRELCAGIIESQQAEIDPMHAILERLENP